MKPVRRRLYLFVCPFVCWWGLIALLRVVFGIEVHPVAVALGMIACLVFGLRAFKRVKPSSPPTRGPGSERSDRSD
jgi:hypothetical protein